LRNYKNGLKVIKLAFLAVVVFLSFVRAQGPGVAYYYHPETELPWAECFIYHKGGSKQKIPFFSVVNQKYHWAPMGTAKYSKDVDVDARLVFIGNGIVKENEWNCYEGRTLMYSQGEINVSGKAVVFCPDLPDEVSKKPKDEWIIEDRISEAQRRKAAAVVIFSYKDKYPFFNVNRFKREENIPDIPVISITRESFQNILISAGENPENIFEEMEKTGKPPQALELLTQMRLRIEGKFQKIDKEHFILHYREGEISSEQVDNIAGTNNDSVQFLIDFFKKHGETMTWKKQFIVYFSWFDSKLFYTHHWGAGLADDAAICSVYLGGGSNYRLAVHENTHSITYQNWPESSSFLSEGIAKCTEALATDREKNHRSVLEFIKENELFPLSELVNHEIGKTGKKTVVGYPAAGSFVEFLIESYGMKKFKTVYGLEGRPAAEKAEDESWDRIYGKSLKDLEKEWLDWLDSRYGHSF
jgi:hypothetical protein